MTENRILITGASGFIGTNLVQYLIGRKETFLNVDIREPFDDAHRPFWIEGDILDKDRMEGVFASYRPTHVIHLAARTDIDEAKNLDGYRVNIQGTQNILQCIAETPSVRRATITSSMLVCRLGHIPSSDEDCSPPNLYGQSKVLTERLTRESNLPCTWLITRPTTIWGPWSFRYRDEFFAVLRKGLYFHPGNEPVIKTYGYAGNVVHQMYRLLELPAAAVQGKTVYLGDPPLNLKTWVDQFSEVLYGRKPRVASRSLLRIVARIGDYLSSFGLRFPLTTFRLTNMITSQALDTEATVRMTGQPPYTIDEGMRITAAWLDSHPRERQQK